MKNLQECTQAIVNRIKALDTPEKENRELTRIFTKYFLAGHYPNAYGDFEANFNRVYDTIIKDEKGVSEKDRYASFTRSVKIIKHFVTQNYNNIKLENLLNETCKEEKILSPELVGGRVKHCKYSEKMKEYIRGKLPEQEIGRYDVHLIACKECNSEVKMWYAIQRALEAEKKTFPKINVVDRVMNRIRQKNSNKKSKKG